MTFIQWCTRAQQRLPCNFNVSQPHFSGFKKCYKPAFTADSVVLGIKLRASHTLRQMQDYLATPASRLLNFYLKKKM